MRVKNSIITFICTFAILLFIPVFSHAAIIYEDDMTITTRAVHMDEKDLKKKQEWEIADQEDIISMEQSNQYDFALFSDGPGTDQTGMLGDNLTGYKKEIYSYLETVALTSYNNGIYLGIKINHDYADDESIEEMVNIYKSAYKGALIAYLRDHYDKFLWANTTIGIASDIYDDYVSLYFIYVKSPYYSDSLANRLNGQINQVVGNCQESSREDKLKYYHDWLLANNEYDDRSNVLDDDDDGSVEYYFSHSAFGCLLYGRGVCESYAKAMKLFCMRENIPCLIVSSTSHAWNYVKMEDGKWYMIDCTFDDTVTDPSNYEKYFLVSNTPNIRQHYVDSLMTYPDTSTTAYARSHHYKLLNDTLADCITQGSRVYQCSDEGCQESKTIQFGKNTFHHTGQTILKDAVEEDGGNAGYTGDTYCKSCDQLLEKGEEIAATGNHSWNEGVVSKAADCVSVSTIRKTCLTCSDTLDVYGEDIDVEHHTGHTIVKDIVDATENQEGYTGNTYCQDCGVLLAEGNRIAKVIPNPDAVTSPALSNTSNGIQISWKKSSKAQGYYIYRKNGSSSYKMIKNITSPSAQKYVDQEVKKKNGQLFTYAVRAYYGNKLASYTSQSIYRLEDQKLKHVKNSSRKTMKVTWKKNKRASGYQIQYSQMKTFASGNKWITIKSYKNTSKTIKRLSRKKNYYVRIRSFKKVGKITYYSNWSKTQKIYMKR